MIFDLINNEPRITIEGVFIPEFRAIWEADKSEEKTRASQALSYIYNVADFNSNYAKRSEDEKRALCKEDYLIDEPTEEEWEMIEKAIKKYKTLQETTSMTLLKSAKHAAYKLSEYFYSVDFEERDPITGRLVHSARDLSANLEKIGKLVTSLNELEEIVNKERASNKNIRRGAQPSSIL